MNGLFPGDIPSQAPISQSVDGAPREEQGGIISNRYLQEIEQKNKAKQKLVKMTAYQKNIHELYMPKASDKKKAELEQLQ